MTHLENVREALRAAKLRAARGDITPTEYERLKADLLEDLSPAERATLGVTATPTPARPTPPADARPPLGPTGGRDGAIGTRLGENLASLDFKPDDVILGKFQVIRELGRGGFGAVYEARHVKLGEIYAVKVLDPAMVAREDLLARFKREVRIMQRLVHPHIARVFDYDERTEEGLALFAMELVKGCSAGALHQRMREPGQHFPVLLAARILHQGLDALAEAHKQGVIHRDVTPANLLLATDPDKLLADPTGDPCVKLIDFGIAGLVERTELSQKSRALGTAAYVAPEVLDPDVEVTAAADVYGAGAVAYHLLTNVLPVGRLKTPREHRRDLPEELDKLILSLLETAPADRPSAEEALERLGKLLADPADGGKASREEVKDARKWVTHRVVNREAVAVEPARPGAEKAPVDGYWVVDPRGSGSFRTVEEALAEAPPGTAIHLKAGTHRLSAPLHLATPVLLVGEGIESTYIVSNGEGHVIWSSGNGRFAASDLTFMHEGRLAADVVIVQDAEVSLTRCRFCGAIRDPDRDMGGSGLRLLGKARGRVERCEMFANQVGLLVEGQVQTTLEGNTSRLNPLVGIGYVGTSGGTARNNTCEDSAGSGIHVAEQAQPTLEGNICQNNGCGITYDGASRGTARSNTCSRNGKWGIYVDGQAQPTLEGNTCQSNESSGVAYFGASGGLARKNTCADNAAFGIHVCDQAQPTLEGNRCPGNQAGEASDWRR